MSSISRWKKLFGRTGKPTFKVLVGEATEEMTDTQAYRFDELTHAGPRDSQAASSVLVFEYPLMSDPSVLNFEAQTLQELSAWGGRKKNVLCE